MGQGGGGGRWGWGEGGGGGGGGEGIQGGRIMEDYQAPFSQIHCKKSGNWGLHKIDCHRSHKGQCTSKKYISS